MANLGTYQMAVGQAPHTKAAKRTFPATLDDVKAALEITNGHVGKAADMLGVTRPLLQRKIDMSPNLQRKLDDILQRKLDDTEEKLFEQVEMGNVTAITFALRMLGKERGYTEKSTLEHELGQGAISSAAAMVEALRKRERDALPEPNTIELKEDQWQETKQEQSATP